MTASLIFSLLTFFTASTTTAGLTHQAQFPGGAIAGISYVQDALAYPELARENSLEGEVTVAFFVLDDGSILRPKVIESLGMGCDEEVLRVISAMPNWIPARVEGDVVTSRVKLRVRFSLP